jgi:hypothetical protein
MGRFHLQPDVSPGAQKHPYWAVVDRVAASQPFHSAARMREFLFYVCDCALRGAPEEATEQHIGIHVFQRPPGYNASEDSIVRTHARSLRQKLAEYFSAEGADEEIVISIPKGHYLPVFEPRHAKGVPAALLREPQPLPARELPVFAEPPRPRARQRWSLWIAAAVLLTAAAAFSYFRPSRQPDPVDRFWAPFMVGNSSQVIYSNALFVGNSKDGMRYADPMTVQPPLPSNYVDDYTGIGELTSVYDLARLFDRYHSSFVLKRSLLVTWDQARNSSLIFIGSVAENPSLRDIPNTREFTMMRGDGFAGIVNNHPLKGESAIYQRPEYPLTRDYAILALLPGLQPGNKILIFSGLTTYGTQAAVEFACHRDSVEQLLERVRGPNGQIRPFEAVLKTSIVGGVPVETHLVTVHLR